MFVSYRFTLINAEGEAYQLPDSPRGWDDLGITLERSEKFHAVNREVPDTILTFIDEAAIFIETEFAKDFVDAEITLQVEITENQIDWHLFRNYVLHFANLTRTKNGLEINFNSGEIENKIESNLDTTYEIELDETSVVKPVRLMRTAKYTGDEYDRFGDLTFSRSEVMNNVFLTKLNIESSDTYGDFSSQMNWKAALNNTNILHTKYFCKWEQLDEIKEGKSTYMRLGSETQLISGSVHNKQISITIRRQYADVTTEEFISDLQSEMGLDIYNLSNQCKYSIWTNTANYTTQASLATYYFSNPDSVSGNFQDITLSFEFDFDFSGIEMRSGDSLLAYAFTDFLANKEFSGNRLYIDSYSLFDDTSDFTIDIKSSLLGETVIVPSVSAFSAFNQILAKITGTTDILKSIWFKNILDPEFLSGKHDYLTVGKCFKSEPNKKLSTSLGELFENFDAIYCLGLSIEMSNKSKNIRIETLDYFYELEYAGHLGDSQDYIEELSTDIIYNSIKFELPKANNEEYSTRFAFNVPTAYKPPIDSINTAFKKKQNYYTNAIRRELARRAASVKDSSDYEDDIYMMKQGSGFSTLLDEKTPPINGIPAFSGIPDISYLANQDFMPARALSYYWAWWINAALINVRTKEITLEENDYNRDFTSTRNGQIEISSGQDFIISDLVEQSRFSSLGNCSNQPRLEPFLMRFKAPMTFNLSKLLENNRHKIFSIDTNLGRRYGYIRKVPTIPGKLQEFELIKASKYAISESL